EFDFIRREIVVGGIAGSWFVHLSAALVSGLFFSTALTLIMVPVMITAPSVIGAGIGRVWAWINGFAGNGREREAASVVAGAGAGTAGVSIPEGADSSRKYITRDGSGLVEREEDGVTVVSRQA